ncbi:hypothetical protein ACTXIU_17730, partial [Glutamicibacter arilaitensis]|uniref:hypothetical protein n=1 Tax=Glutamicibacter arilaitensis TaxID=256701 RepID=UPI003FD54B70
CLCGNFHSSGRPRLFRVLATCPGSRVLVLGGYTLNPEEPVSFGKLSIDIGRMKKNTKLADADPKRDRIQLKNSRSTNQRKGGEVRCIEIV